MRTVLVTSSLTFVPENYDRMVCEMASCDDVVGLIVLNNKKPKMILKALMLMITMSAPRLGLTLLKNYFGSSSSRRRKAYIKTGKKIWNLENINSLEAVKIISDENIDLMINSRTRFIYKENILQSAKIGCINIHHGLLPEQRGLMCDFWAHLENNDYGFSIHQMTKKIDDGPILKVVNLGKPKNNYLDAILAGSEIEAQACKDIIEQIKKEGLISGQRNQLTSVKYQKNPSLISGYKLQLKGIKV